MSKNSGRKRLLIYAHYYIPDTASTGQILCELAEGLLDQFEVTVICAVPSYLGHIDECYKKKKYYREHLNGVTVLRVRVPEFMKTNKYSRIRNILAYFFGSMSATWKTGPMDYVLALSQPPILGGLLGIWGKWIKHARFIYNIQDFNPEQIRAVGYSRNRILLHLMLLLDKFSCRQSDLIITVGRDLVETVRNRFKGKHMPRTVMINNWINEKDIYPLETSHPKVMAFRKQYNLNGKFVFMYSGNIGLYYDLENLIRVLQRFGPGTKTDDGREVAFVFVGNGSMRDRLISYAESRRMDNVIFIPYQEKENLLYSLNAGDVHWVVNAKGIKGVSCPSKYYGCAAVQAPILGVLEKDSEIRCIIEETGSGLCADPGDYETVRQNICWFVENAGSRRMLMMGRRGRINLEQNLSRDVSIRKYAAAISGL